ncbi:MAG: hypothetical protein ACRENZ_05335 [Thermodesulfobacteriota bacterium]
MKIFSIVFVISMFALVISLFLLILLGVRHFFEELSETEIQLAYTMIAIFIMSIVLVPISFYYSHRLDKKKKGAFS